MAISFVAIAVCALLQKYYGPARPDSIWSMIQSILSDIVAQSFIYGGEVFLILFIVIDSGTGVAIHDGWRADEFSYLEKLQSKANLYLLLATLPLIVVPVLLHSRYPLSLFVFGLAYFGVRAVLYQTRIGHHLMRPVTSLAFRYGMKGSNFAQK